MSWLRALADADASCGGKAANLARLIAAGLPVPDGFVLDDRAFRFVLGAHLADVPQDVALEVARRTEALGVVAVRSSANLEDARTGSGAGVFASITGVAPGDVWPAIRAVWASALAPLAATYARGRPLSLGVIVQRFVPGERIVVYTRAPGAPERGPVVVQRATDVRHLARDDEDPIVALALRAEDAIGAVAGADVELVETAAGDRWIVQARPIVHPAPAPAHVPPPPALLASLVADGRRWAWDVAHNPDPLSPAQAGLVERVERAQVAPWSLRVCAGYLYTAPRTSPKAPVVTSRADLEARAASIEASFVAILGADEPTVDEAIERYVEFYGRWSTELVPLIAATRHDGVRESDRGVGARPSAVESTILAAARGEIDDETAIAQLAVFSPAWDVAVPTFGERPEIVRAAIDRARNLAIGHPRPGEPSSPKAELARAVADLAERDDRWFARAQAMVRAALLRHGRSTGISVDDICWLSLDDLAISPEDARRRASAARAAHERATRWSMPVVVGGEHEDSRPVLHGFGAGTRISGRVVRFASLASAIAVGRGDVIVARAITPALAVFVIGCAAIISETGGPLDHGAAIARELGIPYVVGCREAWTLLRDGMLVTIDGDVVIVG